MAQKKWVVGVAAFLTVTLMISGFMALASEIGSKDDPIPSMSYISTEFTPVILEKINAAVSAKAQDYAGELDAKYNRLANELESKINAITAGSGSGGALLADDQELIDAIAARVLAQMPVTGSSGGGEGGGGYVRVDLSNGQTVSLGLGSTVFLRGGSATCVTSSNVGLINLTAGTVIDNGQNLEMNNQYACTIDGRGFKATSANTIAFIMGTYTITT
ncbi:MAG: hypothetical protein FWH06_01775 [Oscillospiraceae bacterium]|nr:hypothetical protein [Oscillospiraceae bacterium]